MARDEEEDEINYRICWKVLTRHGRTLICYLIMKVVKTIFLSKLILQLHAIITSVLTSFSYSTFDYFFVSQRRLSIKI